MSTSHASSRSAGRVVVKSPAERQSEKRPAAEQQTIVSLHVPTIESRATSRPRMTILSSNELESPRMILYSVTTRVRPPPAR